MYSLHTYTGAHDVVRLYCTLIEHSVKIFYRIYEYMQNVYCNPIRLKLVFNKNGRAKKFQIWLWIKWPCTIAFKWKDNARASLIFNLSQLLSQLRHISWNVACINFVPKYTIRVIRDSIRFFSSNTTFLSLKSVGKVGKDEWCSMNEWMNEWMMNDSCCQFDLSFLQILKSVMG